MTNEKIARDRKKLADELSSILRTTRSSYKHMLEEDRMEQARNGATTIVTDRFTDKYLMKQASQKVHESKSKALTAIDKAIDEGMKHLTVAPSTEAANFIVSISQRNDLSEDEVNAALSRYQDHASQKAICAAAVRSGMKRYAAPTDAELYVRDLRDLRDDTASTYTDYEFPSITDGKASFIEAGYRSFADGSDTHDVFSILDHLEERQ